MMDNPCNELWYEQRIKELEEGNTKLRKVLEIYSKERERWRCTFPEYSGHYFLVGGYGEEDKNFLPKFVEISPAYGAGWVMVYERTDRTISYEGS